MWACLRHQKARETHRDFLPSSAHVSLPQISQIRFSSASHLRSIGGLIYLQQNCICCHFMNQHPSNDCHISNKAANCCGCSRTFVIAETLDVDARLSDSAYAYRTAHWPQSRSLLRCMPGAQHSHEGRSKLPCALLCGPNGLADAGMSGQTRSRAMTIL